MTDDDVRDMLRRRAADVTPSADAWEQIQARLEADERPVAVLRRHPVRLAAGGAAAAAVAALVVGQVLPGSPTTQVATPTTTEIAPPASTFVAPSFPVVFPDPSMSVAPAPTPMEAATRYLEARAGVAPGQGQVVTENADAAEIVFLDAPVYSDVFLRRSGDGWYVDSSTSDLVQLYPSYTGTEIGGDLTIEADGRLFVAYRGTDGREPVAEEERLVERLEMVTLDHSLPGEPYVVIRAVLELDDGAVAVAETWVKNPEMGAVGPDTGEGVDTYQGVYPAYTGEELAGYEDMVRNGDRPDLEDPRAVAGQLLGETFFRDDPPGVGFAVDEFQQGDNLSGEVPFELTDGTTGVVLLRRTSPEARVWFATSVGTEPAAVRDVRTEDGGVTVELAPGVTSATAWLQPLPGGDLITAEAVDGTIRLEGAMDGILKVYGLTDDGRSALLLSRVASAG